MNAEDRAIALFVEDNSGAAPAFVVRAPGRVNLIGEHTDYNDGFVLPIAIEQSLYIAVSPTKGRTIDIVSEAHPRSTFTLDALRHQPPRWAEYIRGVASELGTDQLHGWRGAIASDIPAGAGLASSAALEIAAVRTFQKLQGRPWNAKAGAQIAKLAENRWVGVPCGVMDQYVSAAGVAGSALLIDCRSLEYTSHQLPSDVGVVVLDTGTRRQLVDGQFQARRQSCQTAASVAGVPALRDLTIEQLSGIESSLSATTFRRARHVVSENQRTIAAAAALDKGRFEEVGQLMSESHRSLQQDFEVSTPALDAIVAAAAASPGCLGARVTGAGFGGCAVALVILDQLDQFIPAVSSAYWSAVGIQAAIYRVSPSMGASIRNLAGSVRTLAQTANPNA